MRTDKVGQEVEAMALKTLALNDRETHTVPHAGNYPHQWLWDSAFIAIGLSHVNPGRAALELTSLFDGQWQNGMVPHMNFSKGKLDYKLWDSDRNPNAPLNLATSGITQPPVLAEAVQSVGRKLKPFERKAFYAFTVPRLTRHHEWIYNERDMDDSGLMVAIHPYETGMDNTPPWVRQLRQNVKSPLLNIAESHTITKILDRQRRDAKETASLDERTATIDGLACIIAIRKLRRLRYEPDRIKNEHTMLVQDIAMNSILIRNNDILMELADEIAYELPANLIENMRQTENSLSKLYSPDDGLYYSRDFRTKQLLRDSTIAGLMPLYSGALSKERANQLIDRQLTNESEYWTPNPIPSVALSHPDFSEKRMWSGPTWVNATWLVMRGVERYRQENLAEEIAERTLQTVHTYGTAEYFSPLTGEPYGVKDFSWTAALALDLVHAKWS